MNTFCEKFNTKTFQHFPLDVITLLASEYLLNYVFNKRVQKISVKLPGLVVYVKIIRSSESQS